jgi:hypothetical protein
MNKTCKICLSSLVYLVQHDHQFHPFSLKWHNLIPLHSWTILHYVYIHHVFFIHSSVYGHLGWFCSLAAMTGAGTNLGLQASLRMLTNFCGYMPKNDAAGSCESFSFSFLRKLHVYFHIGCTNLHSHQPCVRVSFFPASPPIFVIL